ncbi:MAG: bifunctional phosphoribosyl-AMP cyclohydrolase/phosphoribosyl-ATP diphosphatase HisIE [Candidatus Natronoplasma sp.]
MSDNEVEVDWNEKGLVPVVVQDGDGSVLTLAYMDEEALELTLETGKAHYYSRSKQRIRMKGEVSGNTQSVKEIKVDCDRDALLMKVEQKGAACHTGKKSCFYRELDEIAESETDIDYSLNIMKELESLIKDRLEDPKDGSYTCHLFDEGSEEIAKKFGEESIEVILAKSRSDLIYESADMLYHFIVLLVINDITLKDVMSELEERRK